jgi:hypothetical protein
VCFFTSAHPNHQTLELSERLRDDVVLECLLQLGHVSALRSAKGLHHCGVLHRRHHCGVILVGISVKITK